MVSLLIHIYSWLLRLYPGSFRAEFGAEMADVFQEQMEEASANGRIRLLQACWREMRDWPLHCLQTHWQVRRQRLAMSTAGPPSWWDAAVTGLPYLLFALIVSGCSLVFLIGQGIGAFAGLLFSYGFVFLALLALIMAWWRGWPVWSAAWLSFLFFFLLVLFLPWRLFDGLGQSDQTGPLQMLVSEVGFPLLWLAVLYVLLASWPRYGLVAMLPTFGITWLLFLEFVPESISLVVTAMTWIWLGIVAIVLLRWKHHRWDVWLLYLAGAVVGLIYIFAAHYLTEMQLRDRTIAAMGENVLSELIPVLVPLAGILLLLTLSWWSQLNGRQAVRSYRLLLAGVVLTSIGLQISLMQSRELIFTWPEYVKSGSAVTLLLGCSLMGISVWRLAKSRRQWLPSVNWPLVGMLLILSVVANVRWIHGAIGHGQVWLIGRIGSILWLAAAAWLIGKVRQQLPPIPTKKKPDSSVTVQPERATISSRSSHVTRGQMILLILGSLLLVALLLPATTLAILFPNRQAQPFDMATSLPLFLVMTAGLMMAAFLLSSGFNLLRAGARRPAAYFFSLSALLAIVALRNYYWLAIWDSTYDGLGVLWLFIPFLGVLAGTMTLVVTLPRRARLAAFLYLLVLPPALLLVTQLTQRVDFYQITERRAERVSQALEAYYDQEGHYPSDLQQLTSRYLRSLSEPMIIFDQDWCYEGEGEKFRLGYVYREHWSSPILIGHVHSGASSGEDGSALPSLCQAEMAGLEARDPAYYSLRDQYQSSSN